MKTTDKFFTIIFILLVSWLIAKPFLIDLRDSKQKVKVIDLPEEINVCSVGETLKIERITSDTIFVVFANKKNN